MTKSSKYALGVLLFSLAASLAVFANYKRGSLTGTGSPNIIETRVCARQSLVVRMGPGTHYEKGEPEMITSGQRLYVLEERDGWVRFHISKTVVGRSGWVPKEFTVTEAGWGIAPIESDFKNLYATGLLHEFTPITNEAFVNRSLWAPLKYRTKEAIALSLAKACDNFTGMNLNWVEIKDHLSGKTLAAYGDDPYGDPFAPKTYGLKTY